MLNLFYPLYIIGLLGFLYEGIEASGIRKDTIVFFWGVFSKTEGGDSHWFGIVLNGEFYYCPVHLATENEADRWVLMRHARLLVEEREIERELSEMCRLETAVLEFNSYEAVELAIEEEEVDELLFVTIDKSVVGLDEHEVLSEAEDEVAYVVGDALVE